MTFTQRVWGECSIFSDKQYRSCRMGWFRESKNSLDILYGSAPKVILYKCFLKQEYITTERRHTQESERVSLFEVGSRDRSEASEGNVHMTSSKLSDFLTPRQCHTHATYQYSHLLFGYPHSPSLCGPRLYMYMSPMSQYCLDSPARSLAGRK